MGTISIIIPTLDESKYLPRLLEDLSRQTSKPSEVIVVDGGSQDNTLALAKSSSVVTQALRNPRGTGKQRNAGANRAKSDWLLFLDADVRLDPDYIAKMLASANSSSADIVCPWFRSSSGKIGPDIVLIGLGLVFWLTQRIQANGAGPSILVKKQIFDSIGGFDPAMTHDDIEFIRRASTVAKYRVAPIFCRVSDRRFRSEGTVKLAWTYFRLGLCFMLGRFDQANVVDYQMSGGANEQKKSSSTKQDR